MSHKSRMPCFGKTLQWMLDEKGLSHRELARQIGVSNSTVSRWAKGEGKIDIDNLCAIAWALGTDPNTLCGWGK